MLQSLYLLVLWVLGRVGHRAWSAREVVIAIASEVCSAAWSASRENIAVVSLLGGIGVCTRAGKLDLWDVSPRWVALTVSAGGTSAVLSSVLSIPVLVGVSGLVALLKSVVVTVWSFIAVSAEFFIVR